MNENDGINAMEYLEEVSNGLTEMLRQNIYHIDVKSDNIIPVCDSSGHTFKFIDF